MAVSLSFKQTAVLLVALTATLAAPAAAHTVVYLQAVETDPEDITVTDGSWDVVGDPVVARNAQGYWQLDVTTTGAAGPYILNVSTPLLEEPPGFDGFTQIACHPEGRKEDGTGSSRPYPHWRGDIIPDYSVPFINYTLRADEMGDCSYNFDMTEAGSAQVGFLGFSIKAYCLIVQITAGVKEEKVGTADGAVFVNVFPVRETTGNERYKCFFHRDDLNMTIEGDLAQPSDDMKSIKCSIAALLEPEVKWVDTTIRVAVEPTGRTIRSVEGEWPEFYLGQSPPESSFPWTEAALLTLGAASVGVGLAVSRRKRAEIRAGRLEAARNMERIEREKAEWAAKAEQAANTGVVVQIGIGSGSGTKVKVKSRSRSRSRSSKSSKGSRGSRGSRVAKGKDRSAVLRVGSKSSRGGRRSRSRSPNGSRR